MTETTTTAPNDHGVEAKAIDPGPYRNFLHDGEHVLLVTRQHMWMLVDNILKAAVPAIILLVAAWFAQDRIDGAAGTWIAIVLVVLAALLVIRLLWDLLSWSRQRMVVTNEKVLYVSGVFNRNVESTPLVKIDDITVEQPFFGRIMGFGKLLVDEPGGGKQPLYDLHYIKDPAGAYRTISGLARRNRAWEGGADVGSLPPS